MLGTTGALFYYTVEDCYKDYSLSTDRHRLCGGFVATETSHESKDLWSSVCFGKTAEDCSSLKCLDPEQLLVACYAADPEPELGYL